MVYNQYICRNVYSIITMKIANLIMTYTCPEQTERMIKMLQCDGYDFYIHVDKKISIEPYTYLEQLPNTYLIKNREIVRWAGYNTLIATFNCIDEICTSGKNYTFINFVSGQDYLIKSSSYIYNFFKINRGKEFLSFKNYVTEWPEGMVRIKRYSLINFRFKGKYIIERIMNLVLPLKKLPYNYHPYGESMFWMLSPECALFVANKVRNDKKLRNFFKYTWGADEFVFSTILMNSKYKDKIVNNNYRYMDWSAGGSHPKVLGVEDFDKLKNSEMLFARKFDMNKDADILDLLDDHLKTANG